MKKKKKNNIPWLVIFMVIGIIAILFIGSSLMDELSRQQPVKEVCYKRECTIWGCQYLKVDIDSQACELKGTQQGFNVDLEND